MTENELRKKQMEENEFYKDARGNAYNLMRKRILKSLWRMSNGVEICTIEKLTAIMDEVEKWEEEWGRYGRRNLDLKAHFVREWEVLWADKNIFEETYSSLQHRLN